VRPLRAPGSVKTDDKLVTITLRECEHWPERNSNLIEWIKAAKTISDRGYRIIFIRDTRFAADQIEGFETAPQAARNIAARAKLYAQAFVNIGISNGPMWLALAMDAAVLMLKPVTDSLGTTHCSSYFKRCGIDPGEQIPGAPIWQRLAWNEDTAIEIVRAFDEYVSPSILKRM
jgi:ADP-heptose:LPS heptosyltransferase